MLRQIAWAAALLLSWSVTAASLKVSVNANDDRKALLKPKWENWRWKDAMSAEQKFGDVTVTLKSAGDGDAPLQSVLDKKVLANEVVHMGASGVGSSEKKGGDLVMVIAGLSGGTHSVVTYHHELRGKVNTDYSILVDGKVAVPKVTPTRGINLQSDYDIASAYVEVEGGKPVTITIHPLNASSPVILNGFAIDVNDPHKMAIKPAPADDDEHFDIEQPLAWTAPAGAGAKSAQIYLGETADAVANATPQSPEFKGDVKQARFTATQTKFDSLKSYFWRVDEVVDGKPTRGDVWRFRPRHLAFPTAEGYGRFAIGGRGGRVIEVTNLEDYDKGEAPIPGSYRAAIEAAGPRTVVFRVSGLIKLKRECGIHNGYITIAGQTAPGDGICIANYSAGMATNDAIVRFIRVRVGDEAKRAMDGLGLGSSDDSIIDHCSISWAMDEGTSSRGGHNITFQWNIISEMLQHGYHYNAQDRTKYETHAFAGSISGNIGSFHHNLLAHCTDRNWSLAGGLDQAGKYAGLLDIRNNVVYNWTARTTDGGVKDLDYVNNYYKPYPRQPQFVKWLLMLDPINDGWGSERVFMSGNVMEGFNYDHDNWSAYNQNRGEKRSRDALIKLVRVDQPLYPSYVKDESARDAHVRVLASAGAIYPKRDVIDTRIADEAKTGTVHYTGSKAKQWAADPGNKTSPNVPGIIDTPTDTHDADNSPNAPWPDYKTYDLPQDSDHDGIPDAWEKAHGLDPNDPSDANGDFNGDGYTNLEKYLNELSHEYETTKR